MIDLPRDDMDIYHLIPESIYDDFPELGQLFHVNDAIQNGVPLPSTWHYKHPAYTDWVRTGLESLSNSPSGITAEGVAKLRSAAMHYLMKGVNDANHQTINQFWRNSPHILPFE